MDRIIGEDKMMIYPKSITVKKVSVPIIVDLQKKMSKAVWRPAPGRKLGFLVLHSDELIAILFISSPVINLSVRDEYLSLSRDPSERGKQLRNYMDISVCVGKQPISWFWNIGKLAASIATTLEHEFEEQYEDCLIGLTTTSLYGHGSQYNRLFKFLGYTKGYGHEHIDDEKYTYMLNWMKEHKIEIPSCSFGSGSNPRMRRISAYYKARGEKHSFLHGNRRGVYYHESISTSNRTETIEWWYERWGLPRYERTKNETPPYISGLE